MNKDRQELVQSFTEKMMCVVKGMHAKHGFPFGELKLSRPLVMILFYISKKQEGVSSKDLAKFLNVTSGAITQFVDTLAEKKLVRREEDAKDRRLLRIKLTAMANEKFAAFKKNYYKSVTPAFDRLSEKQIRQCMELLSKINL